MSTVCANNWLHNLQMVAGGNSFNGLRDTYVDKCNLKGWPILEILSNSKNGHMFSRAFKLHCIITLLNGSTRPLGESVRVISCLDNKGKGRCGLEAVIQWMFYLFYYIARITLNTVAKNMVAMGAYTRMRQKHTLWSWMVRRCASD